MPLPPPIPTNGRSKGPPSRRPLTLDHHAAVERMAGDEAIYAHVCRAFVDGAVARLDALRLALEAGDLGATCFGAHTLRGGGLTIGADRLAVVLGDLEGSAARGDLAAAGDLLAEVALELLRVCREVELRRVA